MAQVTRGKIKRVSRQKSWQIGIKLLERETSIRYIVDNRIPN